MITLSFMAFNPKTEEQEMEAKGTIDPDNNNAVCWLKRAEWLDEEMAMKHFMPNVDGKGHSGPFDPNNLEHWLKLPNLIIGTIVWTKIEGAKAMDIRPPQLFNDLEEDATPAD